MVGEKTQSPVGISIDKIVQNFSGLIVKVLDFPLWTASAGWSAEHKEALLQLLKPGDLLLSTDNLYPGWQLIQRFLFDSSFAHISIYEGDGNCIEAISPFGVIRSDLKHSLKGSVQCAVIRPEYRSPEAITRALDYARSQMGKAYNSDFDLEDEQKLYCSQLVLHALQAADEETALPIAEAFGLKIYVPDNFKKLPGAEIVYSDSVDMLENMASHYPGAIGGIIAGSIAWVLWGKSAALGGFVAGTLASLLVGGRMQKKKTQNR